MIADAHSFNNGRQVSAWLAWFHAKAQRRQANAAWDE